jgi:hypothetical protein
VRPDFFDAMHPEFGKQDRLCRIYRVPIQGAFLTSDQPNFVFEPVQAVLNKVFAQDLKPSMTEELAKVPTLTPRQIDAFVNSLRIGTRNNLTRQ